MASELEPIPTTEPQTETPAKAQSDITWENTIKGYFLARDIECMKKFGPIDLSNRADVSENAADIYERTKNKSMPKQMYPYTQENPDPKHPLWTDEMCANFKAWQDAGFP